jgi:hypothetical protein
MKKLLLAAVLLSACGGKSQEADLVEKRVCGNQTASITFAPDYESMKMTFERKTYNMKRHPSANGMHFATSNKKVRYRGSRTGDAAIIEVGGIEMECK